MNALNTHVSSEKQNKTICSILQGRVIVIRNIKMSDQYDFYPLDSVGFLLISA